MHFIVKSPDNRFDRFNPKGVPVFGDGEVSLDTSGLYDDRAWLSVDTVDTRGPGRSEPVHAAIMLDLDGMRELRDALNAFVTVYEAREKAAIDNP